MVPACQFQWQDIVVQSTAAPHAGHDWHTVPQRVCDLQSIGLFQHVPPVEKHALVEHE